MKECIQNLLNGASEKRQAKYQAEIARQKAEIESALVKFLEEKSAVYDSDERATVAMQTAQKVPFNFTLDAPVLPEVADCIKEELGLTVDPCNENKVVGSYDI